MSGSPILKEEDEEYKMLIDLVEEYRKQEKGSTTQKSGNATLNVIHEHLIGKGIKLPKNPKVKIREVKTRMNLLYLLKAEVDRNQSDYSVHDLDAVLKISNNAVGSSEENTPSEPVRNTFEKFRQRNGNLRFYVVVLVESPNYKNRFQNALVLVFRNPQVTKVVYDNASLIEDLVTNKSLKKSGEWEKLINCLKG
jgi:hypothetical protein